MSSLKSKVADLAATFANEVLAAVRGASLAEILGDGGSSAAPAKRGPGRPKKGAVQAEGGTTTGNPPKKAKRGKGGRLARRSPSDIAHVIGLIVAKLGEKANAKGLRSEQLQKLLKIDKKEISRPIEQALSEKKISKKGQKRSTTYFAK